MTLSYFALNDIYVCVSVVHRFPDFLIEQKKEKTHQSIGHVKFKLP